MIAAFRWCATARSLVLVTLVAGWSSAASATNRTVCFDLLIQDSERTNCPGPGTPGIRRACRAGEFVPGFQYPVGFEYRLYDKDGAAPDDLIGTWVLGASGSRCVTFDWEGGGYGGGEVETHPDVYLVATNRAFAVGSDFTTKVSIVTANGVKYPNVSFRDYPFGSGDAAVAVDCAPGTQCWMNPSGGLVMNVFKGTAYSNAVLALDSAQLALQIYHDVMDDGEIKVEYPTDNPGVIGGNARSRFLIEFNGTAPDILKGADVAHEVGHLVQMMMFEQDALIDDCSAFGPGHALTGPEFESCATTEGWADYVAAVSWWDPSNTQSVPFLWGFDFEEEDPIVASSCFLNKGIEGMVARAFWDLDDSRSYPSETPGKLDLNGDGVRETLVDTNGDGNPEDDVSNLSTTSIATRWDSFADGTSNRQDLEGGYTNGVVNDVNGVNIVDYDVVGNVNDQTFRNHNCIHLQTND